MKDISILSASVLCAMLASNAFAADGRITFNGKVVAASCEVTASSQNMTVTLPTVSTESLSSVNDTSGHTSFTISLENCQSPTTTAQRVRVAFTGTADSNNMYVLKNTATTAAATNVGLQIFQADGTTKIDINNGANKDVEFQIPASDATSAENYDLNYVVAYTNTTGTKPTGGNVQAVTNFSVEYN